MRSWWSAAASVIIIAWAAWLLVSPVVAASGPTGATLSIVAATYRTGSLICHQQPARSLHIQGVQTAVCARCLGLYWGAATGSLVGIIWFRRRVRRARPGGRLTLVRKVLLITAAPTLILWVVEHGLDIEVSNLVRLAIALPLGASVAAFVVAWIAGVPFDDSKID